MATLPGRANSRLRRPGALFVGAFALAALLFVAATVAAQMYARAIDSAAASIAHEASLGIGHLAAARGALRRVAFVATPADVGAPRDAAEARRALDTALHDYLALPPPPGGDAPHETLRDAAGALNRVLDAARSETLQDDARLHGAADQFDVAAQTLITLHVRHARGLARTIERRRAAATQLAVGLDAISLVLGALAAALAARGARSYQRLIEARRSEAARRADELEQFAGRVAHDVRGPLAAVVLALDRAASDRGIHASTAATVARGRRSIDRLLRIVDDLLAFARAGAAAEPGARASVCDVLREVVEELEPEAAAGHIELRCEDLPPLDVACGAGVLASVVSNLLRNAVNHMGERPERRVTVRVASRGAAVRVEVEDTGPGMDPEMARRSFEPYVRGAAAAKPGIGLGLATVRRLVEAHHGRVGVASVPGEGSRFWFELPRAAVHPGPSQAALR